MSAYDLPTSLVVGGVGVPIRYGWRAIIDIFAALKDPELDNDGKAEVMLRIFYPEWFKIPEACIGEALQKCREFIDCGNRREDSRPKLMDWEQDAPLIIPAINQVAKCEIRLNPDIHWWTFLGWYMEIGDGIFANILHIRQKRSKHTGTYYNYTMIVAERHGNRAELDRFWEDISKPVACHVCEFPYGQKILTQRMYVQTGAQDIRRLEPGKTSWGEIAVEFIAKKPRVIA